MDEKKSMPLTRREFVQSGVALSLTSCTWTAPAPTAVPIILDSDIGDDIDDTWALLMLLRSPEVDLKLVVGDFGNAGYRGRLFAKLLELGGHTNIPIGLGVGGGDEPGRQSDWLGTYRLSDYPGVVHEDGVDALISTIKTSPSPVTLLCIGPVPNIAEALRRDPSIADNTRFVGMHGSVRVGYGGAPEPAAEWNVKVDPVSLQSVFAARWPITLAPLDTCGLVRLMGERYRPIAESEDPLVQGLLANYRAFLPTAPFIEPGTHPDRNSTTLFDTVACHLTYSERWLDMENIPLTVTADGFTRIDPEQGRPVRCAVRWKDLAAFQDDLVDRVLGKAL